MKSMLLSGKVKPDMGGQVLDLYNQQVYQGIAPIMLTTIDSSSMTFVTVMNKQIIHTAPNGKKYSIQIRKYTPRDCFRLMGVHEADIDKILSKEKSGASIICKSKLYALFTNKTMVLWYKGKPIIGTMHDGLWYQQDMNGMWEQLMFQSEVTHVSFLPSPYEDRERTNPSHHR